MMTLKKNKSWKGYTFDELNDRIEANSAEIAVITHDIRRSVSARLKSNKARIKETIGAAMLLRYAFKTFMFIRKVKRYYSAVKSEFSNNDEN